MVPVLGDAGQALGWARAERDGLLACLNHVTRAGQDARVIALTAALIVIGEYERAFYGSQYGAMAPLFEHYGVQLWMPEAAAGSTTRPSMTRKR